jgi:hypothetical protein
MRYNRLMDLGLTEPQVRDDLMFASNKIGDTMNVAMRRADAKEWFGAPPPDLSVVARSRGADWLYAYLRSYYRDDTRPTGWNNLVFPNVGMPNVLWKLQGQQILKTQEEGEGHSKHKVESLILEKPGELSPQQFDMRVCRPGEFSRLYRRACPGRTGAARLRGAYRARRVVYVGIPAEERVLERRPLTDANRASYRHDDPVLRHDLSNQPTLPDCSL